MRSHRKFSAEEKYAIVEESLQPGVRAAEVCRRHGIASSLLYRWQSQAKAGARQALEDSRGKRRSSAADQAEQFEEELRKKNDIIAELTEALIAEKKGDSTYLLKRGSKRK